jgi:copper(I)-binding protein
MTSFHQKHIFGFGFSGALALAIAGLTVPASAQVAIESRKNPSPLLSVQAGWVRPSVPGQQGTGGYMRLTAREGQQLVAVSSPLAGVAEVHEMKMDGEVMRMRAVGNLELPAGKTVELKPGGLHLMLMDLKQPLTVGSSVPLSLVFRDQRGVESRIETRLLVSPAAPDSAAPQEMHKH